jgi:hypothetical protein
VEQVAKLRTFVVLIQKCLCSGKKSLVHVGLDFYIILLSAQRFGSDGKRIEESIKHML